MATRPNDARATAAILGAALLMALFSDRIAAQPDPAPKRAVRFICDEQHHKAIVATDGSMPGQPSIFGASAPGIDLSTVPPNQPVAICKIKPGLTISVTPRPDEPRAAIDQTEIRVNGEPVGALTWSELWQKMTVQLTNDTGVMVETCKRYESPAGVYVNACHKAPFSVDQLRAHP